VLDADWLSKPDDPVLPDEPIRGERA